MSEYNRVINKIPELFTILMVPHIEEVNIAFSPGMTILRWTSINLEGFLITANNALSTLEHLIESALGIHNNRIMEVFSQILQVPLTDVPSHDVISVETFIKTTDELCQRAVTSLENKNLIVETAVLELIELLLPNTETLRQDTPDDMLAPGALTVKRKIEQKQKLRQEADMLYDYYQQLNIDTLIQLYRGTLENLRKRVAFASALSYTEFSAEEKKEHHPLFIADVILSLPSLVIRPSLDEIQQSMNHVVNMILSVMKGVHCWGQERTDIVKSSVSVHSQIKLDHVSSYNHLKTYYHSVSEHKEVNKLVSVLNTCLNSTKNIVHSTIDQFNKYEVLWAIDRDERVKAFSESEPSVSDYQQEMHTFQQLEEVVQLEPDVQEAGAICLHTDQLKVMLVTEAKQWRVCYGRIMSQNYQATMDRVFVSIEEWGKLLSRPLKDLDDVRSVMATLKEIRENEIRIDMCLGPIEVMYMYMYMYMYVYCIM